MKNYLLLSFIFLLSIISGNYSTDKNLSNNFTAKNFCFNATESLIPAVKEFRLVSCSKQFPAKITDTDLLIFSNLNSDLTNSNQIIDSIFL